MKGVNMLMFLFAAFAVLACSLPTDVNFCGVESTPIFTTHFVTNFEDTVATGLTSSNHLDARSHLNGHYTVICETTTGSPQASNVLISVEKLNDIGWSRCYQKNNSGSKCTKMSITGDAAVAICGDYGLWIPCWVASEAARHIQNSCVWKGLAGGKTYVDDAKMLRIIVYHS